MDRSQIEAAIAAQEQLRATVGDDIVDSTIAALRSALAELETVEPQRKLVTVLFADVVGFTRWSESADAEDVGASMSAVWSRLDQVIADHNGRVDKHVGDSVMAMWGARVAREDDAEYAIRAALAIRAEFLAMTADGALAGSGLSLRIGVNTGPVILREVGLTGEYTALGDAVNVAARLEAAAPIGEILIGHDTYRHVRGVFTVAEQPPLQVKGKQASLRTYLVRGTRPRAFRLETRGVEGLETRMVGRDAEFARLCGLVGEAVESGSIRLATVVGEAGLGKSRLLSEFLEWVQLQPVELFLLMGRSDAQHESTPYALLKDVLNLRFEINEDDPAEVAVEKLVAGFDSIAGLGQEAAHLAAHLIGLDVRSSPLIAGMIDDPQQLRDRGEQAIVELVLAMAAISPILMVLEDIHWADTASLDLVERFVAEAATLPLIVVAAARPVLFERRPQWGRHGVRFELHGLSSAESEALVADVLQKAAAVPEALSSSIVAGAEGNPFYVEELVKSMIEAGAIRVTESGWVIDPSAGDLSTPPTLTALLQARLDRLSVGERRALQQAAVVGRIFWDGALLVTRQATSSAASSLDDDLGELQRRELVIKHHRSAFQGSREYSFKHALLRDVTYESVLLADRRVYHRAVAEWLAGMADGETRAAVIANHLEAAGATEAAPWHVRAGTQARLRFANEEALAAYTRALELGGLDDAARFEALDGSGELLMLLARYAEAVEAHRAMLDVARAVGDLSAQARALTGIIFAGSRLGPSGELAAQADEAIAAVLAMPDPDQKLLAEALRSAGWIAFRGGDLATAKERGARAAAVAESAGDRRGLSMSLNLLSLVESSLGNYRDAETHMETALGIDRELGDRRAEGVSLINLGEGARRRGDYETAAARSLEALEILRDVGDRDNAELSLNNLGGVYVSLGRYGEAVELLEDARAAFEAADRQEYLAETKRFLAEAHLGLGEEATALALAKAAVADADAIGDPEQSGHAWRVLGLAVHRLGGAVDFAGHSEGPLTADGCFAKSLEYFAEDDIDRAVALADWSRATVLTDEVRASRMWDEATSILGPLGLTHLAGELRDQPTQGPAGW